MIKVIVHGFMGRMGRTICRMVNENTAMEIAAGIDANAVAEKESFPVFKSPGECNVAADVIIDFSTATAVPALLEYAKSTKTPVVICTTGLDEKTLALTGEVSRETAVFRSANMSLGINLLAEILSKYSGLLKDAGFDIEILEKHHNMKIDAPSGTALLLADAVNEGLDEKCSYVYDRSSLREKRPQNVIGISSMRGGNIVGEHDVIFAGPQEVVEFSHAAQSRDVFGQGAVSAAGFIAGKGPGMYSMRDLFENIL